MKVTIICHSATFLFKYNCIATEKQVDILMSKNQVLKILYLKHQDNVKLRRLSWIRICS